MLVPEQQVLNLPESSGLGFKIHPSFTDQQQLYSKFRDLPAACAAGR